VPSLEHADSAFTSGSPLLPLFNLNSEVEALMTCGGC
jgi:hypothetical protein